MESFKDQRSKGELAMVDLTPEGVRKYLNAHGHAFHYAVIRRWHELSEERESDWTRVTSEFPVGLQNTIHIDFILRSRNSHVYLVAECKRADPARANWCFVKAPYTRGNASNDELVFQEVEFRPGNAVSKPRDVAAGIESCNLGFELKTGSPGEGASGGGSAIKDATNQVLRGLNGLVDHLFPSPGSVSGGRGRIFFLPVIFTTATLWVVTGDLSAADVANGRLPADWGTLKKAEYLWFNHNQSPALRHQLPYLQAASRFDISTTLHAEYTRSIAVVGSDGIDAFFKAKLVDWLIP
jgi:hypothetical protein